MARADSRALEATGFNPFLFAGIGQEFNGMTLSVISLFAREGSDPWLEAGRLAGMSEAEAVTSLSHAIAAMPESPWTLTDAGPIATRLIALLPGGLGTPAAVASVQLPMTTLAWWTRRRMGVALLIVVLGIAAMAATTWTAPVIAMSPSASTGKIGARSQ